MKNPAYYVAVFGKPEPPDKDVVESGRYHLGLRGTDTPGDRGDVLLLYCTASHADKTMNASGIGIVLTKTKESIFYRYLPFTAPISKDILDKAFTEEDREKFSDIKYDNYWLFEISRESFSNATRGLSMNWP